MWEAQCIAVTWHLQEVALASRCLTSWVTPFTVFHTTLLTPPSNLKFPHKLGVWKNSSPRENTFPLVFRLQGWLRWSIKALKWLSGSCGGSGTLAKPARFAWNMTKAAWNPPAFPSIRLTLPKHLEDLRNIQKRMYVYLFLGSLLLMVDSQL